jgi:hypothetical protein
MTLEVRIEVVSLLDMPRVLCSMAQFVCQALKVMEREDTLASLTGGDGEAQFSMNVIERVERRERVTVQ